MIPAYDKKINRKVRVFISSTFADMQTERNIIVHSVFPRLRKEFSAKLIDITEVDLRWGIPEEDAENSRILEICIGEVLHCAPFFVGIVGGRYGSIASDDAVQQLPPAYKKALGSEVPSGLSITELEMRAGVFVPNNVDFSCFFVKREVELDEGLQPEIRKLLEHIEGAFSSCPYSTEAEFEETLYTRLKEYIAKMIPERLEIPYHDPCYYSHLKILKSNNYRYAPDNYLIAHFERKINTYRQVYLQGEKGTGKSACMSWLAKREGVDRDGCVFFHFAAAGNQSANLDHVFFRLRLFLQTEFGASSAEENSHNAVIDMLKSGKIDRRVVLFFDAMDQLRDMTAIYQFFGLTELNENVFVVCSGTEDYTKIMGEQVVSVGALSTDQISQIVNGTLSQYGKRLNRKMKQDILRKKECENPLFLRALLSQLIVYGAYDTLDAFFGRLLEAKSYHELFAIMAARLKHYFSECRIAEEKVDMALALLVYSNNGVKENELQEILDILPVAKSIFLTAIDLFTIEDNGRIRFNHDLIVSAAKDILQQTGIPYRTKVAEILIAYFEKQENDWRKFSELPFQYCRMNMLAQLQGILTEPGCFEYLCENEFHSCIGYLSYLVGSQTELAPLLTAGKSPEEKLKIARLLCLGNCHRAAIRILEEFPEQSCEPAFYVKVLTVLARSQYKLALDDFRASIGTYQKLLSCYRTYFPEDELGYASQAYLLGVAYKTAGDAAKSIEMLTRCVRVFQQHKVCSATSIWVMDVYVAVCHQTGKLKSALEVMDKVITDCKYLFGRMSEELAWAYCYCWNTLYAIGDKSNALKMVHDAYEIFDRLYHGRGAKIAWAAVNEGTSCLIQRNLGEAERLYRFSIQENDCILPEKDRPHVYSLTAYANLASLCETSHRHREAAETIRFALETSTAKNGELHAYTANILLAAGIINRDPQMILDAIARYRNLKPLTPDLFFGELCLARVYAENGESKQAEAVIERCAEEYFSEERETGLLTYLILDTKEKIVGKLTEEQSDALDELFLFDEYEYYITHNNNSQIILIPKL